MATTLAPASTPGEIRSDLLIDGYDPSSFGAKLAFRDLSPRMQARYLHRIDYLEADVAGLLASLGEDDRLAVLAYRDADGTWRD